MRLSFAPGHAEDQAGWPLVEAVPVKALASYRNKKKKAEVSDSQVERAMQSGQDSEGTSDWASGVVSSSLL